MSKNVLDKGLFNEYEKCMQDEPAATTARCPVHVEVPELCAEIVRGDFRQAYAVLAKRVPFAGVFCLVCDHPCEQACVRGPLDAPVRIGELERAAVRYGYVPFKKRFKTSKLNGKVAVVGGGISGLSAAFDLDRRGYAVTLFEKNDRLGGWLWELVGKGLEVEDIKRGLEAVYELAVDIRYGQLIDTHHLARLLDEYDAVFLGTGEWAEPVSIDPATFRVGSAKLCAGGTLAGSGDSVIEAVSSGKRAAITLERMIKNISLTAEREREGAFETLLPKSLEWVEATPAIEPSDSGGGDSYDNGDGPFCHPCDASESLTQVTKRTVPFVSPYTREQAQAEASRCLQCACDECIKACVHMQRYKRKPKTYAREIYTNENVFLGTRYANKMINSCTLCGLCGQRCPLGLSMEPLVRQTRASMVDADKMPPSAHDFALRDMAFSNSEQCALLRMPQVDTPAPAPEVTASVFFPGCQLAASAPQQVEAVYAWLRETNPQPTGIWLGCCGAPADWAGHSDLFQETIRSLKNQWEEAGCPKLILACSSCKDIFDRYLPEILTISLWTLMAEKRKLLPESPTTNTLALQTLNIHDACSTRHDTQLHDSVRALVMHAGYKIEELRYAREDTKCCGYGGLVFYANREQEGDFAVDRAKESPHDLLVYCAMCKDLFIDAGKRTFHLLDLFFPPAGGSDPLRDMPTLSKRQTNRAELRRNLLSRFWGETDLAPEPKLPGYTVVIPPEVQALMEERLIVSADIEDCLAKALADPGARFFNPVENSSLISIRKQYVTYWVRYEQQDNEMVVLSVYSHRMDILKQD